MIALHDTLIVRIAEIEVDPAQIDAYLALLRAEIEASIRLEPGVLSLMAVTIRDQPQQVRILETYRDPASYEAHLRSPHFLHYNTASAGMVRALRLIDTDPVALGVSGGVAAAQR